jgi:hypothetical protein
MENIDEYQYAQQDFNLPHDVVQLPSGGIFYKSKKKSIKVGYLTAADENIISNVDSRKSIKESIILPLLRNRVYEKDLRPEELLSCDIEAILIFLRNTSFGPEYNVSLEDPITGKKFSHTFNLDELNIKKTKNKPDEEGLFTIELPITKSLVKVKPLTLMDNIELDRILEMYPSDRTAPTVTLKLNKQIVELNGKRDLSEISVFSENMPIADSKYIRKFLMENEPGLELTKTTIAPSGEKVSFGIAFGVEFFRPFFGV